MSILKPVIILVIAGAALLCSDAVAVDPPPRHGAVRDASRSEPPQPQPTADAKADAADKKEEPKPEPSTDAKGTPVKSAQPPHSGEKATKAPVKRRPVRAQLDDDQPSYRPTLTPPAPVLREPMPQSTLPPGPVILNGCTGGHCNDQNGQRYNPVGTTLISPQGRLCNNNGISVSCY